MGAPEQRVCSPPLPRMAGRARKVVRRTWGEAVGRLRAHNRSRLRRRPKIPVANKHEDARGQGFARRSMRIFEHSVRTLIELRSRVHGSTPRAGCKQCRRLGRRSARRRARRTTWCSLDRRAVNVGAHTSEAVGSRSRPWPRPRDRHRLSRRAARARACSRVRPPPAGPRKKVNAARLRATVAITRTRTKTLRTQPRHQTPPSTGAGTASQSRVGRKRMKVRSSGLEGMPSRAGVFMRSVQAAASLAAASGSGPARTSSAISSWRRLS